MTLREFIGDLEYKKIRCGLQVDAITGYFKNRRYCTDITIALGIEPVHGTDASIEYHFNTDKNAKPTLLEDGSVDFFHLNVVNDCKAGDELATLTPADPGQYGMTVLGEKVKPRNVKVKQLKFGHDIKLSEDKLHIYSEVNGHVELAGEQVFVSNVLEVENVDTATGNVEYNGSVKVNGNVATNFEVKATGDIEIKGVVEGARIEAGGNIVIVRGNNGMGKAELIAGGNIISKFLENTKVEAGGRSRENPSPPRRWAPIWARTPLSRSAPTPRRSRNT